MNRIIDDSILTDIANTIREKNGTNNQYEDTEMPQGIESVYNAGYEKGKAEGGSDEFIGVKYSEFIEVDGKGHYLPTVGDARSLEGHLGAQSGRYGWLGGAYLFAGNNATTNTGYTAALKTVYLPSGILSLNSTFLNCVSLENIYGDLSLVESTFATFSNCQNLKELPYMPNIWSLGQGTFSNCRSLTSVTLYKVPTNTILSNVFANCTSLTEVTIPQGWNNHIYLQHSTLLTQECLHRMIENLADMTGQTAKKFQVGATNIAKIDEEHINMLEAKNFDYS